jgi:hypothetical protein
LTRRNIWPHISNEARAWIVPWLEGSTPTCTSGSSVYPAVQNMLLAARALRLGATNSVFAVREGSRGRTWIAPGVHSYALLPIGYPICRFGPVRRTALADVVYEDLSGQPYRDL